MRRAPCFTTGTAALAERAVRDRAEEEIPNQTCDLERGQRVRERWCRQEGKPITTPRQLRNKPEWAGNMSRFLSLEVKLLRISTAEMCSSARACHVVKSPALVLSYSFVRSAVFFNTRPTNSPVEFVEMTKSSLVNSFACRSCCRRAGQK